MTHDKPEEGFHGPWWKYPPLRSALVAGVIAGLGFVLAHAGLLTEQYENWFYWIAIPMGGWHWVHEGIEGLVREREVGIDVLMIAATLGAALLGLWDEAAALVVLYGAAEGTEEYTYARTRHAIRALLDLAPKEARLLRDGQEITVPAETLKPGDVFRVRPGEAIPTDGVILRGQSSLDESPVTGESIPVDKGPQMKVFAASINRQGALDIQATAAFADNTLSKIIHLVEEAQERKGRAQQWIERFGRRYSPAVLSASALLATVPWVLGLPAGEWAARAVVLLVAAAPCALVMSTPVAMAAAIGAAGRQGILIKGGVHLEHLGAIRVVAFDKTGTLTRGEPQVTDVIALAGAERELLSLAAGLEQFSEHPLARAIMDHARALGIEIPAVDRFEALAGAGARAVLDGRAYFIGNAQLLQQQGANVAAIAPQIEALQQQGKTVVLVGGDGTVLGLIALRDRVRDGAKDVVRRLHSLGVRVVMLTGDNRITAEAVARELGIDEARAALKPEDKVRAVGELTRRYGPVLMVGDGVNDAPALAAATCGVAMGVAGSDAAIESADVALMADDLAKVETALAFGRKSRGVRLQNIAFSVLVLALLIPAAVSGWMNVAFAVVVHEVSELLAVANGLRAGRVTDRSRSPAFARSSQTSVT
jgi:heavy metal translocating P-type ATPase